MYEYAYVVIKKSLLAHFAAIFLLNRIFLENKLYSQDTRKTKINATTDFRYLGIGNTKISNISL